MRTQSFLARQIHQRLLDAYCANPNPDRMVALKEAQTAATRDLSPEWIVSIDPQTLAVRLTHATRYRQPRERSRVRTLIAEIRLLLRQLDPAVALEILDRHTPGEKAPAISAPPPPGWRAALEKAPAEPKSFPTPAIPIDPFFSTYLRSGR
jgi:hypothetical protein